MDHTPPVPPILYKYCPPGLLDPLVKQTLRITPFNQLNDPLECMPVIGVRDVEKSYQEGMYRQFQSQGGKRGPTSRRFKAFLKNHPQSRQAWREAWAECESGVKNLRASFLWQSNVSSYFGVVCLSETPTSMLMWSHYADKHTGYVLGIKSCPFEQLIEHGANRFAPINYSAERPKMTLGEWNEDVVFSKSEHWAYEREWRLSALLEIGKPVAGVPGVVVMNYGIENLVEIIVGLSADERIGSEIDKVKAAAPHVKVRFARPSSLRFEMLVVDTIPPELIADALRRNPNFR